MIAACITAHRCKKQRRRASAWLHLRVQVAGLEGRVKEVEASLQQQQQQHKVTASSTDVSLTALDRRVCTLETSLAKQQQMQVMRDKNGMATLDTRVCAVGVSLAEQQQMQVMRD
eukprot:1159931-Pelagomonas_calceolata.AAC.10